MFLKLLLLFTLFPLLELYLLIELGRRVGVAPTILLVVITGFCGVLLARAQGFRVLRRITGQLRQGLLPGDELLDGLAILIGAALLLTPGLISDTAGLLLLVPGSRGAVKQYFRSKLRKALEEGTMHFFWR
ncbi:MAG: hypothetical protein DDT21_01606 [Syntrophomonadaceae bacterium]|nr:hypothetical protein [Bacillota bacterium]